MPSFLGILASLVAYIAGLVLIVQVTPRVLFRSYDEPLFMIFAVLDILGAFLTFGSIVVSLAWNWNIGMRVLDCVLLVIVMFVTGRMALFCFRNYRRGIQPISRFSAGNFCLFLSLASLYYIVQLFKP